MIHHRTTLTIVLTLVLTAIAAAPAPASSLRATPAVAAPASGSPQRASPVSCGDVCSGHGYGAVNVSNRTPASQVSCGDVCSGHGYGPVSAPATVLRVLAPGTGFDWGDAGIGAGTMLALTMIGLGGVLAATRRRGRQPSPHRASAHS